MHTLIVGCGYLGERVARRWCNAGHHVSALTRSVARSKVWDSRGIAPIVGDVLAPDTLAALPSCDILLYAVGFDRTAGVEKRTVYVDGLQNVLQAVAGRAGRVIYISSTSVYGQDQGETIDESSPTIPQSDGGQICLAAEQCLRDSEFGRQGRTSILRMAGIYGPDRLLARIDSLRDGTSLAGSPDAWLNLIHVDDAASVAIAAAATASPHELYLVSDDRPVTRGEYYGELARLTGAPQPRFDPGQLPRHGNGLNKRCCNGRVRQSLGVEWLYPTMTHGLPACLGERRAGN